MKILPIQHHKINNIKFKGLCIYTGTYTPEPDEFIKSSDSIDIARLKKLDIPNFRLIDSSSVRGATLANSSSGVLSELKESGIQRVIDLRKEGGYEIEYAKNCRKNGLDYFKFAIPDFQNKDEVQKFIIQLPDFFEIMNIGRNYMACLLGLHRSDLAASLNYLLNPQEPSSPPVLSHIYIDTEKNCTDKYINTIKNLLKHNNGNFAEILKSRIIKLRMINGLK